MGMKVQGRRRGVMIQVFVMQWGRGYTDQHILALREGGGVNFPEKNAT